MKKRWGILLILSLLLIISYTLGGTELVKAASDKDYDELKLTAVSDIEVYNYYYNLNTIEINNMFYPYIDTKVYKFTLGEDGFVNLILTANNLTKEVARYSSSGLDLRSQVPTVTATVYRDEKHIFEVVPTITAKGSITSSPGANGETKEKVALDKGTYYVVIRTDKYQPSSNANTYNYVKGKAELIIYYQPVESDEIHRPSSVGMENPLKIDETFLGILTVANPKDYYSFDIKERSLVTLNYMYESPKKVKFILYGDDWSAMLTKQFTGSNEWRQEELLLDKGTYYCSLESVTKGDGGQTNIEINAIPYPLELKQVGSSKNSHITVDTIEVPKEVRYLKGVYTQEDINNSRWRKAEDITEDLQFGVNETGNYSVRVTDDKGNMFVESIRVRQCDIKAPAKPKINKYVAGEYEVTGTAEKNSAVTVVYGNREYTSTASSKGNYACVINSRLTKGSKVEVYAQDISGNVSNSAVVTVK